MQAIAEAGAPRRSKVFGAFLTLGVAAALVFPFWLRSHLLDEAVSDGVWNLKQISDALPRSPAPVDEGDFIPLFPLWPGKVEGGPVVAAEVPAAGAASAVATKKLRRRKRAAYRPLVGPTPVSSRASAALVLSWVNSRVVPTGVTRPPYKGIPAGIELKGVAGLGVGLIDGDRLVTVGGAPVDSRGLVVGAVLAARSRGAPAIHATLVRMTKEGPKTFTIAVEQPYLDAIESVEQGGEVLTERF